MSSDPSKSCGLFHKIVSFLHQGRKKKFGMLIRALAKVSPPISHSVKRQRWEVQWENESKRPESELSTVLPHEVVEAVDNQWFPPGSRVLDIGSGRGQISAWLADRGFNVVGADFSDEATRLAKKFFGHLPSVRFLTADACSDSFGGEPFDVLLDRGCFHTIITELQPLYVSNIAKCAITGAKFMLFHPIKESSEDLLMEIRSLFEAYFEIFDWGATQEPMVRSAGTIPRTQKEGVVFRLIRKPA